MNLQFEREEQQLADGYAAGFLTLEQYNKAIRDLQREMRDAAREAAEEAAERAYRDTMDSW